MFKARWRSDKNKIKALFKLRLEAMQVPRSGWESLVVSLVPLDVGKVSVKSERAVVVEGTCAWDKAIFETVKLSWDPKTWKINEKLYRFVVSGNELARGRVLGEATFDFADYVESIKPSDVSIQLNGSSSSTVLHVTVQRVQDDANGRDEGIDHLKRMRSQLSNGDKVEEDHTSNGNDMDEDGLPSSDQAQLRFHSTRAMVMHVEPTENIIKSRSFDASSAIYVESGSERNTHSLLSLLHNDSLHKATTNPNGSIAANGDPWGSNTEWSLSSALDKSLDGSTNSSEEIRLKDQHQEPESLEKLKNGMTSLARQVEVSELELQALRKQVVKERRQGDDLYIEASLLKDERDLFKRKCELLKASSYETGKENISSSRDREDLRSVLEETKHELDHERNLNANLNLQLQKMQDSNSELIFAVEDLEEILDQKTRKTLCPNCHEGLEMHIEVEAVKDLSQSRQTNGFSFTNEDRGNEELISMNSEHEEDEELQVLTKERNNIVVAFSLEQKIAGLITEMLLCKKDRDKLEIQLEQLALDYEILKQEKHDLSTKYEQSHLREQLRMQYECSAHSSIISDLEARVEHMEKELKIQAEMFEEDLAIIMKAKIEQEQRAIRAEEALQKAKQNNVSTAAKLQDEFRKLSSQMSTTFVANEKMAMKAIAEVSEQLLQKIHLKESLEKAKGELVLVKNQFKLQLKELLKQVDLKTNIADELQLKFKNKSEELDNELKIQQTMERALSQELASLKSEIQELSMEKRKLSEQINGEEKLMGEIQSLKKVVGEREMLLRDRTKERDSLAVQLRILQDESKKLKEVYWNLQELIREKEMNIKSLRSDLESLRARYTGLTKSLGVQMEKERLNEQVRRLKNGTIYHSIEDNDTSSTIGKEQSTSRVESPDKDAIASTASIYEQGKMRELLREVEVLKDMNHSMEDELKQIHGRYSELSLKFAEVEGERQQLVMRICSLKNMARS